MAKTSVANSLKGKIWLAAAGLAFFICVFGLISYLIVSFLTDNPLYSVFVPFGFAACSVVVFGWWLAGEIAAPVEKVSLLARSMERGFSTSFPKTSGATETDELMQTLERVSQLVQKLVGSMEEVANGNLNLVFAPADSGAATSDRVSQNFQKLLARVSESIHAKQELDKLEAAINQLSTEVANVKTGNLMVEINSDFRQTGVLSETIKFLVENLSEIVREIKQNSSASQNSALEVSQTFQEIIQQDENRVQEMKQASISLKKLPQIVQKISEELSASAQTASQSIEKARKGTQNAQLNLNAVSSLRKQLQEATTRIERLDERSREINKIVKTIEDLAQRTSLVALNASIQATELGERGQGFSVVAEEVERLAERAAGTNKYISTINQAIRAEIGEVARSLEKTAGETANLSKYAIETGNALGEMERYIASVLNLQNKVTTYAGEQSAETEKAFDVFVAGISETETASSRLKEAAEKLSKVTTAMQQMQEQIAPFKLPINISEEIEDFSASVSSPTEYSVPSFEEEISA